MKAQYDEAVAMREASLDQIARAMSDLASSSRAPVGLGAALGGPVPTATAKPATAPAAAGDR